MISSTPPSLSLHHGGLSVSNLEQSLEFYKRVLGFELDTKITTSDGSMTIVHMKRGQDYLELFCHQSPQALPDFAKDVKTDFKVIGTKHVAFSTNDPEGVHLFLQEQGVEGLSPIHDNNPHYKYFFFKDPDGIILEIVSPRSPKPEHR